MQNNNLPEQAQQENRNAFDEFLAPASPEPARESNAFDKFLTPQVATGTAEVKPDLTPKDWLKESLSAFITSPN